MSLTYSTMSNARYDAVDHPIFGYIKGIRVLDKAILLGQEILVDYGFDGDHGYPIWWQPSQLVKSDEIRRSDEQPLASVAPRGTRARLVPETMVPC